MPKEVVYIAAQPDDLYFAWQIEVQINNFRKYGISDKLRYLMFLPSPRINGGGTKNEGKGWNKETRELPIKYPEVQFYWYEDVEDIITNYVNPYQYIPLLRPYCLARHFAENPDLKEKAIFYLDSDVLFTRYPDFVDKYKDDDVCYLSDTKHYIAASYWDSKYKDVIEEKKAAYKSIDPLDTIAKKVGISREVCVANEEGSGGAQYLLKNIDHKFWLEVFKGCLDIRGGLSFHIPMSINKLYFENEDKGFQSWCADMWSVLWNLWKRDMKTVCPPEMDFAWATDPIARLDEVYIFHNAGATHDPIIVNGKTHILFDKRGRGWEYVNNKTTPFADNQHHTVSPDFCSAFYCKEVEETKKNREFSVTLK